MTNETASLFHALEQAKNHALEYFQTLDENQMRKAPEGEWNMLQVIEHILFSETGTLGYMKKKTSGGFDALQSVSDAEIAAGNALVDRLKSAERYKAPAILPQPEGQVSLAQLKHTWDALRLEMSAFIHAFPEEHLDKLVFKQPAAGMLTLHDALRFLTQHIEHHYAQLERLKKQI